MSSSIAIPKRKQPVRNSASSSSPANSSSPSSSSSYGSPDTVYSKRFGKSKVDESHSKSWERRRSLLGSSFTKSEHAVVALGHSEGTQRLVTYVSSGQGFDWNQELFLPSYMDSGSSDLERRPDPVHDIILSDEEAAALLP